MKTLLSTLIYCCCFPFIHAQISGEVVQPSGEGIPFANVILASVEDSTVIEGALSNESGFFEFREVVSGQYFLQIKAVGFKTMNSTMYEVNSSRSKVDVGQLEMEEYAVELEGVELRAQKSLIQQTMEGTVLNVQSSVLTKGSSALQVLERSPGIFVDKQNGGISLNGQSGAKIMINGKLVQLSVTQLLAMLEGMSADNIEKIEFLTSPSARHDAEGSAGLINLVLKKREDAGTNGSISLTGGYGWAEKATGNLSLNHRKGKTNVYGMYTYSRDHSFSDFYGKGDQVVPVLGGYMNFDFWNESIRNLNSHNINIGLEQALNETTTIGGNITMLYSHDKGSIRNLAVYNLQEDSILNIDIQIGAKNRWRNAISSLFLEKEFQNKGKLHVDADYLYYENRALTSVNSTYFSETEEVKPEGDIFPNEVRGNSQTSIQVGVFKADYEQQFNDKIKIEMGIKGTYAQTENQGQIERKTKEEWITDPRSINSLRMDEIIGAAYFSSQIQFNATTQMVIGARYEVWDRKFKNNDMNRTRGNLFPSFFFSKQLSEANNLNLSYTQRISRPEYNDLVSYLQYNGPISVFSGNPLLQPNLTNQLKLSYQYKSNQFALVFKHESNPIARYQTVENATSDLVIVSPQNVAYQRSVAFEANIPLEIFDWWKLNIGGSAGWREFELQHTKEPFVLDYLTYNLNGNQTFLLPGDFSIELSGWYLAPFYEGSRGYEPFGMLNAGIRKQFKGNGGSLQFTVDDIFKSLDIVSYFGTLTEEAFSSRARVRYEGESGNARIFKLSYSYNFGNSSLKGRSHRKMGAEEEKSRVRTD